MESPESKSTDTPPALPTKVVVPHAGDNKTKKAPVLSPEEIAAMRDRIFGDLKTDAVQIARQTIKPEQFADVIDERKKLYACAGLDALRDLACMPIADNSMQNQVKYLAAKALVVYADAGGAVGAAPMDDLLAAMRKSFNDHAPRIRVTRETIEVQSQEPKLVN
jgi:hypothetical protein